MDSLDRDPVFIALTRPQTFAGVTYSYFVANVVISAEAFLIFRSLGALALGIVIHGVGMLASVREPRIFDLWFVRVSRCPRVRNYAIWRCNSYRP